MARPGVIVQAGRAALLIPAQPFANGGHGGGEQLRRAFDPALFGALDKPQAMVVRIFHFTHQVEIASGGGHDDWILRGPRDPFPNINPIPSTASHSYISTSPGEYDVHRLSQAPGELDRSTKNE